RVCFRIEAAAVPQMDGALQYVKDKQVPGGLNRNREYLLAGDQPEAAHPTGPQTLVRVSVEKSVPRDLLTLLFDPQTSGGLLAAVPVDRVAAVRAALDDQGVPNWEIGEVVEGRGVRVG